MRRGTRNCGGGKEKDKDKIGTNVNKSFVNKKGRRIEGRRGGWGKAAARCIIQAQMPHDDCYQYVYLRCTNKTHTDTAEKSLAT